MAQKTINQLIAKATAAASDLLPIFDVASNTTKRTTVSGVAAAIASSFGLKSVGFDKVDHRSYIAPSTAFPTGYRNNSFLILTKIGNIVFFNAQIIPDTGNVGASVTLTIPSDFTTTVSQQQIVGIRFETAIARVTIATTTDPTPNIFTFVQPGTTVNYVTYNGTYRTTKSDVMA